MYLLIPTPKLSHFHLFPFGNHVYFLWKDINLYPISIPYILICTPGMPCNVESSSLAKPRRAFKASHALCFSMQHECVLAKSLQSCLTLWNPIDHSLSGSSVHGILQARILEWVAILFSRGSSQPRDRTWVSCIAGGFFTTRAISELSKCESANAKLLQSCYTWCKPMNCVAHQAPLSMGFSRQEYWSGLPFPSLGFSRPMDQTGMSNI